jgi:hypothetical protein
MTYTIVLSCMRNNGSWARAAGHHSDEVEAVKAFRAQPWEGPTVGRSWSRTITLVKRTGSDREVIEERRVD